uniref:Uncharacterized protein n=1 Tax=Rhizophora mucronata TaxID=61149 RepID=A0A2P2QWH5_RHIMU
MIKLSSSIQRWQGQLEQAKAKWLHKVQQSQAYDHGKNSYLRSANYCAGGCACLVSKNSRR